MDIAYVLEHDVLIDRFWAKVDKSLGDDNCWLWLGKKSMDSYGHFTFYVGGKSGKRYYLLASRVAYASVNGLFDRSLYVCHRCDNPPCVNPLHLFLGTPKDNQQDAKAKGRRASKKGELHGYAKLCERDVLAIRALREYEIPAKIIASAYRISEGTIYAIARRATWTHI